MPNMIATARTPYIGLPDFQSPPRVISEIRKPTPVWPKDCSRPRITGELLCYNPTEGCWRTRRVAVRSGQLLVGSPGDGNPRLSLRRLNLTPGPAAHSFALRRSPDTQPLLTLQASNQKEFDNWVRTIAIELIRQTPLDAIKYLDIFTLTPQLTPQKTTTTATKDCNHNCLLTTPNALDEPKSLQTPSPVTPDENKNYMSLNHITIARLNSITRTNEQNMSTGSVDEDEQTVELLLKKCQNSDSYVPVKEKLKLFESLCRLGRLTNDDNASNPTKYGSKRTRSLHDLSHSESVAMNTVQNAGVKQICKYFENKKEENKSQDGLKYNTIARVHRTSIGPVRSLIDRKYSAQIIKC